MKTALITGASQGIGAAIASILNRNHIKVILVSRSKKKLKNFQKTLKFKNNSAIISKDISYLSSCESIRRNLKKINYLINVAGATQGGEFLKLSDKLWNDGFNLKFKAAVRLTREFWQVLKKNNGKVINIGGGAARTPSDNFMIGGAVNSALDNFSKALAILGKKDRVGVYIIHPGMTLTRRLDSLLRVEAKIKEKTLQEILKYKCKLDKIKRPNYPEEVGKLVYKLIKEKKISFKSIAIEGGKTKNLF
jgi:short-subunit dehydrogenase